MTPKIDKWMRDAAGAIVDCESIEWAAAIIASYAPSAPTQSQIAAEMYAVLERLIAAMERNDWDHETPALYQDAVNIFKKADGQASEAAAQPYGYKLPSCESGSITVSNQTGKGADSQRACNPRSTSRVSAPDEIDNENDH